ncbi:hypothetical protein [Actinomycetospora atypica]|uniref:DUF2029 domain-containing protein n=1 Tax=Actinomycetospora atypica TaxID=1290095 RepID=A0ABV9YP90_9PSEU
MARLSGLLVLALMLAVVSSFTTFSLGAQGGTAAYTVGAVVVLAVLVPAAAPALRRTPSWALWALVVLVLTALVTAFVLGVPDGYRAAFGAGSDRADALDVVLTRLSEGLYPYAASTYVGNPISPLPGSFVLAAPFWWATGDASWQNVLWLVLLLGLVNGGPRLRPVPTVLWALVVVGGLEVLREFVVGDDLVWSAVPAALAVAWLLRCAHGPTPRLVVAALLVGLTTCTRPHLVLVLVAAAVAVGVLAGLRRALLVGGLAAAVWAVLIAPFLTGGLARFSPVHVAAKVTGDRAITPGIVVVAVVALAVVVGAAWWLRASSAVAVGWLGAAVLFAPSVLSFAHALVAGAWGELDLTLGSAGVPFALWAVAAREVATAPDGPPARPSVAPPRAGPPHGDHARGAAIPAAPP